MVEDLPEGWTDISIHALREEGDFAHKPMYYHLDQFLSTPSARRATSIVNTFSKNIIIFLSTPSARRATGQNLIFDPLPEDFYPRPPRGGRRCKADAKSCMT